MKDLLDYYSRILTTMQHTVDEEGNVITPTGKMALADGRPLVLPTKDNIDNLVTVGKDGKVEVTKTLFNPLSEDGIGPMSATLSKLLALANILAETSIYVAGDMLLTMASNPKLQKNLPAYMTEFMGRLQEAYSPGMKQVVDANSVTLWTKIHDSITVGSKKYLKFTIKKNVKLGNIQYNRVCTISSALYDALCNIEDESVFGVKLRKKDITVFKLLMEFILDGLDDKAVKSYPSNDVNIPGFESLMTAYLNITGRTNKILKALKHVSEAAYDASYLKHDITLDEVKSFKKYQAAVALIPSESEAHMSNRRMATNVSATQEALSNAGRQTPPNNRVPQYIQQQQQQQYVQEPVYTQPQYVQPHPQTMTQPMYQQAPMQQQPQQSGMSPTAALLNSAGIVNRAPQRSRSAFAGVNNPNISAMSTPNHYGVSGMMMSYPGYGQHPVQQVGYPQPYPIAYY